MTALYNCQNLSPSCEVVGTQSTARTEVVPPAQAVVRAERTRETPGDVTLSFAMPGDDGFDGTAQRIIARSFKSNNLNATTCDTVMELNGDYSLFENEIPDGNTDAVVTLSGFDSLTPYCFQVIVEDDAHDPTPGTTKRIKI